MSFFVLSFRPFDVDSRDIVYFGDMLNFANEAFWYSNSNQRILLSYILNVNI